MSAFSKSYLYRKMGSDRTHLLGNFPRYLPSCELSFPICRMREFHCAQHRGPLKTGCGPLSCPGVCTHRRGTESRGSLESRGSREGRGVSVGAQTLLTCSARQTEGSLRPAATVQLVEQEREVGSHREEARENHLWDL